MNKLKDLYYPVHDKTGEVIGYSPLSEVTILKTQVGIALRLNNQPNGEVTVVGLPQSRLGAVKTKDEIQREGKRVLNGQDS